MFTMHSLVIIWYISELTLELQNFSCLYKDPTFKGKMVYNTKYRQFLKYQKPFWKKQLSGYKYIEILQQYYLYQNNIKDHFFIKYRSEYNRMIR